MTLTNFKEYTRFIIIALMSLLAFPASAASKDVTMQVGETQTLYLPSSVTSLNLKSVNFYSNGISYVQVTSHTNYSVTVKAIKAFSSPVIVRCDYYYFVRNGSYTYETKGYYDFNITVVGENKVKPTSISFPSSVAAVEVGETRQLTPTVLPANAEYTLTWHINDTSVATISQSGLLTGKSEGYADLKVSADNGVYTMLRIAVSKPSASSVTVTPSSVNLTEGETKYISAKISPSSANQSVTWTSSNSGVATVSSSGKVTAITAGSCRITAKTSNGRTGYCDVTVNKKIITPTSITLPGEIEMTVGENQSLTPTILPSGAETTLSWVSSDPNVASVSNGIVKAISTGECSIIVTTSNGLSAVCHVKVSPVLPESITISPQMETLMEGETLQLNVDVLPILSQQNVTWESSDVSVAEVSTSGKVLAIKEGSCIIVAKTINELSATCNITVNRKIIHPESISLPESLKMHMGDTEQLTANITPNDSEYTLTWCSTNEDVATVTYGLVTAVGIGECDVIASVGNGLEASCHIIVEGENTITPDIKSSWSGTYHMTYSIEMFKESTYSYPSESDLTIEERNGEYFITSMLGINCTSGYPYEGLKVVVESPSIAYIDLGHNDNLGYTDLQGNFFDGLLYLSAASEHSYEPEPIYLTRSSENEIQIQDFYIFSFGSNTDFKHERDALFTNVKGEIGLSGIIGLTSVPTRENANMEIYNMNGVLLFAGSQNKMPQLEKGLYIIRNNKRSNKILIK